MRIEVSVAAIALILSFGCNKKDPKGLRFDSAGQNSSAQSTSLASAQKADTQNTRPSQAVKVDSQSNRPVLSGSPVIGSSEKKDSIKEKQIDERPTKDPVDNLPDLRAVSIKQVTEIAKAKKKPEIPSTVKKTEDAGISPVEKASKSKEPKAEPIKKSAQPPKDEQVSHIRLPGAVPGSRVQKSIKVQAKDVSEQYEGLKARSKRYYRTALGFLGNQDDSALFYANKAIQIFENGSLFRVKAEALYNLKYFTNAEIACDVCLNRTDHWDFVDVYRALRLKCGCDRKNYERFPSQESKEQYENACKNAAGIAGGK